MDVGVIQPSASPIPDPGGYANAAAQDAFCANTYCWISIIYDQSPKHNHLIQAPRGGFSGPGMGGFNNLPVADMAPITIMGHKFLVGPPPRAPQWAAPTRRHRLPDHGNAHSGSRRRVSRHPAPARTDTLPNRCTAPLSGSCVLVPLRPGALVRMAADCCGSGLSSIILTNTAFVERQGFYFSYTFAIPSMITLSDKI